MRYFWVYFGFWGGFWKLELELKKLKEGFLMGEGLEEKEKF